MRELLKEVDLLEEHKRRSKKLLAQKNERFEHMLTMGRESGDRRGLGYEQENPNSKSNTSTFVKGKGKVTSQLIPNPTPTRVFPKVKATYAQKGKGVKIASTSKQTSYLNAHSSTTKESEEKAVPNILRSASCSKIPQVACYYCGIHGHMKFECRKMDRDERFLRFQKMKKEVHERRMRKRNYFQCSENANLESKKEMERLSKPKTKQV